MADDMMFPAAPGALAGLNEKQQLLRQQLAQTLALQQRAPMKGYGALGGIGAGLANAARGISGAIVENRDREELQKNAEEQAAARKAILDAITGNAPALAPSRIDPLVAPTGRGGFMGVASDMSGPAAATQAAHPIPTSQPVQEAGLAQLAALGIHRPPGAPPAQESPQMPAGVAPQAQPMSGLEQLAALSTKHQRAALALMASGDPMLTHAGETLMERAQREQQMGFQGQQSALDREQAAESRANALAIANKPQMHINPYGQQAYVFDPRTGEARRVDIGERPASTPGALGTSPRDRMVAEQIQHLTDATNPAKVAPKLTEKLQFGDRIRALIDQGLAHNGDMTNEQARELASAFAGYVANGVPGEASVNELLPPSLQGNLSRLGNFLTGGGNGADRTAWLKLLQGSLDREDPIIKQNIGDLLQHNLTGLASFDDPRYAARREAIVAELRQQGYLKPPKEQGGPQTQAPGNFDLGASPTHYLVSPDGKMRIAAGPDGKPLPNAKPEPIHGG